MNGDIQFKKELEKPQQFVLQKSWGEKLAEFLVKYSGGLIKNEKQASYVILGFVALAIIISLYLFFGGGKTETKTPSPENFINKPQFLP